MSTEKTNGRGRWAVWSAGLLVAVGAGVATAHGLFEVAVAAKVPGPIAVLYPAITDGLALVAYLATARLTSPKARRYAWAVVVLAAGLSGVAQAVYLAGGVTGAAPTALSAGVGAWPAVAAAIAAHLLHLLASDHTENDDRGAQDVNAERAAEPPAASVQACPTAAVQPNGGQPSNEPDAVQSEDRSNSVHSAERPAVQANAGSGVQTAPAERRSTRREFARSDGRAGATERAREAATAHRAANGGELPTVTELMEAADVSRGTAGTVLRALRAEPTPLRVVPLAPPVAAPQRQEADR